MICVKVEIWPGGYRQMRRTLGELAIWNVAPGADTASYHWALWDDVFHERAPDGEGPDAEELALVAGTLGYEGAPARCGRIGSRRRRDGWVPLLAQVARGLGG